MEEEESIRSPHYSHPKLIAAKLNNRAVSLLVKQGKYNEGINILTTALKLTQLQHYNNNKNKTSSKNKEPKTSTSSSCCKSCTFQSCLLMDDDTYFSSLLLTEEEEKKKKHHHVHENHQEAHQGRLHQGRQQYSHLYQHNHNHNHRFTTNNELLSMNKSCNCVDFDEEMKCFSAESESSDSSLPQESSESDCCYHSIASAALQAQDTTNTNNGFVYCRPILINKHCTDKIYYCSNNNKYSGGGGDVVSLIILFNLALIHHLKAISMSISISLSTNDDSNKDVTRMKSVLDQALQLYELAYQLHGNVNNISSFADTDTDTDTNTSHLRFTMIVSNNIGEIHRIAGDTIIHQISLQHLLSAIIILLLFTVLAVVLLQVLLQILQTQIQIPVPVPAIHKR